jgi:glutaredoxin
MRSRSDASPKPRRPVASTPRPGHLVTLVHAAGCHLCESARRVIEGVRAEVPFELEEVDITGDEELEPRYRERIPVVLVDGEEAFTYFVTPAGLRRRVEP